MSPFNIVSLKVPSSNSGLNALGKRGLPGSREGLSSHLGFPTAPAVCLIYNRGYAHDVVWTFVITNFKMLPMLYNIKTKLSR